MLNRPKMSYILGFFKEAILCLTTLSFSLFNVSFTPFLSQSSFPKCLSVYQSTGSVLTGRSWSQPSFPFTSFSLIPLISLKPLLSFSPRLSCSPGLHYSQQEAGPAGINTDDSTSRLKNASESKPVYIMFGRGGGTLSLLKNIIKATEKIIKHMFRAKSDANQAKVQ